MLRHAPSLAPAVLLERVAHVGLPDHQRRGQSAQQARQHGDDEGECEQRPAEGDLRQGEALRQRSDQQLASQEGEDRSQQRGDEREADAFGQQLPNEAARAGTERTSHRELALARDAPGQHQVAHIAAPDQQHEDARPQEHEERSADGSHRHVLKRHHVDAPAFIRVGERLFQPRGDRVELRLGRGGRHSRFQASDSTEVAATAARTLGHGQEHVRRPGTPGTGSPAGARQ